MSCVRRTRSFAAWLGLFAIALQAFWPLLAQAKPKNVVLVPLCTVQGVTHYLELPAGNAPVEQKAASQHDHCSFCSGGAALPVAPTLAASAVEHVEDVFLAEDSFGEGRTPLGARSRAPPALS
jgi:hypothetical protein